jgi:hypothetical protein
MVWLAATVLSSTTGCHRLGVIQNFGRVLNNHHGQPPWLACPDMHADWGAEGSGRMPVRPASAILYNALLLTLCLTRGEEGVSIKTQVQSEC